ncbi:hypothetical protein ASD04_12775 [Devosia sp. Root436]|jgi:C4-dicarboxylate transporter DctQ subunit|uniref:TRAP transporter small permease n=1 Tax=Devosia sp. Root436 TaxID=1736537 RepID=UPI00070020AC|nr:TRAP transporter small permease [Devosia sp. Root436]KQX35657.1 hypothetical protein ASD04_12775 [Devosia sp. Root436]
MQFRAGFTALVDILGTVIFSVITVVCFAQIINRYFFGHSFVFAEEMAVQLMIWIAFLGAAKCVSEDSHARLTVVLASLPRRPRAALLVLSDMLCIAFLGIAAWFGFRLVQTTWRSTTIGTGIPEGLVYLAMPVGSVIMIVFYIANSIATIRDAAGAEKQP